MYNLEVSSPGLERLLFTIEQYQRYLGELVSIKLQQPQNGQRKFIGKLHAAYDEKIELMLDDKIIVFELANISKANLSIKI
jgi:ribosome maturation factor RimP